MKSYTIEIDSWWDSPGCDCCESTEMEYYRVYRSDGTELIPNGNTLLENIYEAILKDSKIEVTIKDLKQQSYRELNKQVWCLNRPEGRLTISPFLSLK